MNDSFLFINDNPHPRLWYSSSFTQSLTHSPTHSHTHSTYSLTHSHTHTLTHSLTHSLTTHTHTHTHTHTLTYTVSHTHTLLATDQPQCYYGCDLPQLTVLPQEHKCLPFSPLSPSTLTRPPPSPHLQKRVVVWQAVCQLLKSSVILHHVVTIS